MKLYIKNMVCDRCKLAIKNVLNDLTIEPVEIQLGEVDFGNLEIGDEQVDVFRQRIEALGFELINDRKSRLIESIKKHVIALVRERDQLEKVKLSDYLGEHLHHDYTYLSNLFSAVEGVTIEQYFIHQKIERAKELLVYDELTLTEIADRLGYSSVAHLSRQFKKVTGLTPTHFKQLRDTRHRQPLDKI